MAKMKRRTLSEAAEEVRQETDSDPNAETDARAETPGADPVPARAYDAPDGDPPPARRAERSAGRGLQIATFLALLLALGALAYLILNAQQDAVERTDAGASRTIQVVPAGPPSTGEMSVRTQTAIAQTEVALAQTEAALALAEAAIAQAQAALSEAEGLRQQNQSGQAGRSSAVQDDLVRSLGTDYDADSTASAPDSTQSPDQE